MLFHTAFFTEQNKYSFEQGHLVVCLYISLKETARRDFEPLGRHQLRPFWLKLTEQLGQLKAWNEETEGT